MNHPNRYTPMRESLVERVEEQDAATALLAEVTREATQAKEEYQVRERRRKAVAALVEAAPDRPALALVLLRKSRELLQEAGTEARRAWLAELERDCAARAASAVAALDRELPVALQERELRIDAGSRHPRYAVDNHTVSLEVDTRKLTAKITPRNGDVIREPLDPAAVADRVKAERDRLLGREFQAEAFYVALRTSYTAIRQSGSTLGQGRVGVRDLAAHMAGAGKPRLDEFAVDLGRLLHETRLLDEQGEQLVVTQTRDTGKGLLLHGMEQGGYVGSVEMRWRA